MRSLVTRGHRGAVVAMQRAIHLANGELDLGEGPPWEGTPRVHPNDDRRIPILWVEGGIGQRVVDPQDKEWWKNPHYFKQELLESELTSAIWCSYTHYGLMPSFRPIKEKDNENKNQNPQFNKVFYCSLLMSIGMNLDRV